ncbi:hypothetical protein CASFOL_026111 [Castilleja foliolosa]|uniref:Uncharacterized protein n=1 Tax=Castilleja foliolosa TaxID=1961234 RepID=A0ABD3CUG2_9LAMI
MSSDIKKPGSAAAGGGGFRSKLEHYLYSGEKKHVAAGIAIIGIICGVPWYLMTRGVQSIDLIKITWKRPIKLGVRDFLLVHPQLDEDESNHAISVSTISFLDDGNLCYFH